MNVMVKFKENGAIEEKNAVIMIPILGVLFSKFMQDKNELFFDDFLRVNVNNNSINDESFMKQLQEQCSNNIISIDDFEIVRHSYSVIAILVDITTEPKAVEEESAEELNTEYPIDAE